VTRNLVIAAAVLASGACAFAQEAPALAPVAPAVAAPLEPSAQTTTPAAPPQTTSQAAPGPQPFPRERLQRIYLIRQLESVLTNAVKTGAASLANQLKLADPTSLFVTGNARSRGFELDGYGVVFDVDVPTMMQSVLWSAQMLQRQQEMDQLQDTINDPRTSDGMRRVATNELRRIQRMMNSQAVPMQPTPAQPVSQGMVSAASTDSPATADARMAGSAPVPPMPDPRSPDEMYTDVIKNALIDAMLNFGPALRLGDDEWLTVAARATTQSVTNQLDDSSSIVIRVKGGDLTAFLTGKLSREAVLKKIEIKEG
jgi:hypothetical protein